MGDSTVILAHGEGKVKLPKVNRTRKVVLDLHQVLFVPKLTKNLLSVPAMALMGGEIYFDKDKCLVGRIAKIGRFYARDVKVVTSSIKTVNKADDFNVSDVKVVWYKDGTS